MSILIYIMIVTFVPFPLLALMFALQRARSSEISRRQTMGRRKRVSR